MLGLPFAFWTAMHRSAPRGPAAVHLWGLFLQALGFSGVHSVSTSCADARLSRQSAARRPSRTAKTTRRVPLRAISRPPPPPPPPPTSHPPLPRGLAPSERPGSGP